MVVPYTLLQLCTKRVAHHLLSIEDAHTSTPPSPSSSSSSPSSSTSPPSSSSSSTSPSSSTLSTFSHKLSMLPTEMVDNVLVYMMKHKLLTREAFSVLLPYIQHHLDMDEGEWVPEDVLCMISSSPSSLVSISLGACTHITPHTLRTILSGCTHIHTLSLKGCTQLEDSAIDIICDTTVHLKHLDIHALNITSSGCIRIAERLSSLESLDVGKCKKVDDNALKTVKKMDRLKVLSLYMCALVSDVGIASLVDGPVKDALEVLDISHCGKVTNAGLTTLSHLPHIRSLVLGGLMNITSAGISSMMELCGGRLESLNVTQCRRLDDEAAKSIFKHAAQMEDLCMSFLDLSDEGFKNMPYHSSMTTLTMSGNKRLTDTALFAIANNMPSLQALNLWQCPDITDEGVVAVGKKCNMLRKVDINDCMRITDRTLVALANGCPLLTTVILSGWGAITDEGVKVLAQHCSKLRTISLGGLVNITNESLINLGRLCTCLYAVGLFDCKRVTEEGVRNLIGYAPSLRRIDVGGKSGLTKEQVTALRSAYKHVEIAA